MNAYYNEFDPHGAQWLRNLIAGGHIAPGVVDERDIRDVSPSNLGGFTQCHFFAGVGIWSYALRSAGWRDDEPVWTASCPCQPFSAAGAGAGIDDERHLWPAVNWLAEQCRPQTIFGEQVASLDGLGWFDIVSSDMEATDYAIGAVDTCAAGFGAPHIRQRLYFAAEDQRHDGERLADATRQRRNERAGLPDQDTGCGRAEPTYRGVANRLDNSKLSRLEGHIRTEGPEGREVSDGSGFKGMLPRGMADANGGNTSAEREQRSGEHGLQQEGSRSSDRHGTGPLYGPWANADWIHCRDGKWRPVESGTFPLAHGAASRVGRLRAYGNGLCAEQATGFIRAFMERNMVDLSNEASGDLFEWGS